MKYISVSETAEKWNLSKRKFEVKIIDLRM